MAQEPPPSIRSSGAPAPDGTQHGNGESSQSTAPPKPIFFASVAPGLDTPLPPACEGLAKAILEYEKVDGNPVWAIAQSDVGHKPLDDITEMLANTIIDCGDAIEHGKKLTVVLHTSGGDPEAAYRMAMFLQKRSGGFEVVVPKTAKSGGTLFVLGATK